MRGPRCTSSRHALRPNRQRQEDHEIMLSMSRLEVDDDVGDVTDQLLFGDSTDDMLSVATDEAVTQTAATQLRALGRDLDLNLPIRPTCDGGSWADASWLPSGERFRLLLLGDCSEAPAFVSPKASEGATFVAKIVLYSSGSKLACSP